MKKFLHHLYAGLLLSLLIFNTLSFGQPKIYWVNFLDSFTNKIQRADLDGSNVENVLTNVVNGFSIHNNLEKIYWANFIDGSIKRADLNGNNVENVLTGLTSPGNVRIHNESNKIYWTSSSSSANINMADIDGGNAEELVKLGSAYPVDLALDIDSGKIYWKTSQPGAIQRANLDGSNVETLLQVGNDLGKIALDLIGRKIYWVVENSSDPSIKRADLDGSNEEFLVSNSPTAVLENPWGLTLDLQHGKLYWTDFSAEKIQRANLDGSNVEDVITSGLNSPREIVLVELGTTGIRSVSEIPHDFILSQNYPNPFNPSTKIKFTIPYNVILSKTKIHYVSLKVYDMLSNEVATLIDEEKPSGRYEIQFDAPHLSSGVYFYKLSVSAFPSHNRQAGDFIETKKMILLR